MEEQIAVVGVGRIGAVTAVGMAHLLHDVTGLDRDAGRVAELANGQLREAEPGLRAALRSALRLRRLRFCTAAGPGEFGAAFLCVDTPPAADGSPDLSQLFAAAATAAELLRPGGLLVTRSTVPPGTGARLEAALRTAGRGDIHVVHVPEFLREGRAWEDFREPDRVVIGADWQAAGERAAALFAGIDAPVFVTDRVTAELAKYAANGFLATSVSFANEMADLAGALGADGPTLFDILRADRRIGREAYLTPGLGFGGHCLPKDAAALEYVGMAHGVELRQLRATMEVNRERTWRVVEWLSAALGGLQGRRVALAGLAFKPGTDDLRASPSIALAAALAGAGATVAGFDPLVRQAGDIGCAGSLEEALRESDALVVAHRASWLAGTDPARAGALMRTRVLYDAPGALPAADWAAAGFVTNRGCAAAVHAARGNCR